MRESIIAALVASSLPCLTAVAEDAMTLGRTPTNFFGGQTAEICFRVRPVAARGGRLHLALLAPDADRALWRREIAVAGEGDRPEGVKTAVPLPPVDPGTVTAVVVRAVLMNAAGRSVATRERTLWVFPQDPFAHRREWLKRLDLALFDPAGATAAALEKLDVPLTRVANPSALAARKGLVLVGSGVSWRAHRALPDLLIGLARQGTPVLCLAPSDGMMALPDPGDKEVMAPTRLTLRNSDIIAELDKRLDTGGWTRAGESGAAALAVQARAGRVVLEAVPGGKGWPWFEARYPAGSSRGRLVVCGFPLAEAWEVSPAPRFLFARLLEYLDFPSPGSPERAPLQP